MGELFLSLHGHRWPDLERALCHENYWAKHPPPPALGPGEVGGGGRPKQRRWPRPRWRFPGQPPRLQREAGEGERKAPREMAEAPSILHFNGALGDVEFEVFWDLVWGSDGQMLGHPPFGWDNPLGRALTNQWLQETIPFLGGPMETPLKQFVLFLPSVRNWLNHALSASPGTQAMASACCSGVFELFSKRASSQARMDRGRNAPSTMKTSVSGDGIRPGAQAVSEKDA